MSTVEFLHNSRSNGRGFPLLELGGLRPQVWVSVGSGFAREDVKALVLSSGTGFVQEAITTLQEIGLLLTQIPKEKVLAPSSRQEILRMLLSEPRILSEMPELKRIRRQRSFLRRLDTAIQAGRMAFAHAEEEEVYEERLSQSAGKNNVRKELQGLARAYEAWLEASGWIDPPILIRKAIEVLSRGIWPSRLSPPKEILSLSVQIPESLEREFWEYLGHFVVIKQVRFIDDLFTVEQNTQDKNPIQMEWQKWHTLDDAAESLADQLVGVEKYTDWNQHAVLIPDIPVIRRSLKRALEGRGLPLADPRDPTRLRWDERIKWALLPLEVVGSNFERQKVISWLRGFYSKPEIPLWVSEINARGIRHGMNSYAGGLLADVHLQLIGLYTALKGRNTCEKAAEIHLGILKTHLGLQAEKSTEVLPEVQKEETDSLTAAPNCHWLLAFFEQTWKSIEEDLTRIEQSQKRAPLLFWLEKLQARLREASPPVERLKPTHGIKLYRLQQAPVESVEKLWIFGLPSQWLSGEGTGDYWFSEREREILASEFAVRSAQQVREERLGVLNSWISNATQAVVLDSQFDYDGRERESILPILKELELLRGGKFSEFPEDRGAHPRFLASFSVVRPIQPQVVQLDPSSFELTATTLDRYSRCSFQALGYQRWKLRDLREPEPDLWPDTRGNLLHEAVRVLVASFNPQSNTFGILPQEALNRAWGHKHPKGLLRSPRIEAYVRRRLIKILEAFCIKEKDYLQRSGVRPVSLEDMHLRMHHPEFSVLGMPDRIDQHPDGIFIIDYKSSGTVPHGTEILERGYRLQLAFYALAARKKLNQPVLGVQFVELDRKASRKGGIFFKEHNGKEAGKLTQARSNSKSLIHLDQDEVWNKLEDYLITNAAAYTSGFFEAKPNVEKREKECSLCLLSDLCGFRRLAVLDVEKGMEIENA